mgnify:CR=1 FL=1|jgi:serine/alanine racemase
METAREPRNYWIDIARLIMAVFVVGIHCTLTASYAASGSQPFDALNASLFRMAVPFFLVCTGYFVMKKTIESNDRSGFLRSALKHAILYLLWTAIYLPIIIYQQYVQAGVSFGAFSLSFVQRFFFSGSIELLWYLSGSALGLVLSWLVLKLKFPLWLRLLLGVAFFAIGTFGDAYFGVLTPSISSIYQGYFKIFLTTLNGLFFSFLFLQLGGAIVSLKAQHPEAFSRKGLIISLSVNILSLVLLFVEGYLLTTYSAPRDTNFLWATVIVAPSLLYFLLTLPVKETSNKVVGYLGPLSALVYLVQVYCLALNKLISEHVSIFANEFVKFPVVLLLSIGIGCLILALAKTKVFRWVKALY